MPSRTSTRIARRLGGAATRRRRHRRVALAAGLLVVVAVVLVIAGSGDDGDDDGTAAAPEATGTTSAPVTSNPLAGGTPEEICAASDAELDIARSALLGDNESPGAAEGFLGDAFVDLMRDRSAAIRALEPPPSAEVVAILEEFDAVVDAIEADPSIGIDADPFVEVNALWRAAGLDGCVIGSSTVDG